MAKSNAKEYAQPSEIVNELNRLIYETGLIKLASEAINEIRQSSPRKAAVLAKRLEKLQREKIAYTLRRQANELCRIESKR